MVNIGCKEEESAMRVLRSGGEHNAFCTPPSIVAPSHEARLDFGMQRLALGRLQYTPRAIRAAEFS